MKNLVAVYNDNPVINVYAAMVFKPENIIFLGGKRVKHNRRVIKNYILSRGLAQSVNFRVFTEHTAESIAFTLKEITDELDDCAVDLTCGDSVVWFAAGRLKTDMDFYVYSHALRTFKNISTGCALPCADALPRISIRDFIRLAGGSVIAHGHFDPNDYDCYDDDFINDMWNIYLKHKRDWNKFVAYIQHFSGASSVSFFGKEHAYEDNVSFYCCYGILEDLESIGVIRNLEISRGNVRFRFADCKIRRLLCDVGVWLELHTYRCARSSGEFDDVDMSVVIDWNGIENEYDDVTNEIDVIVTKGVVPVFISCKSGSVNTSALNEIHTLAERFGGKYAKAVILTAAQISEESPRTYRRALEMGITVIEREDLSSKGIVGHLRDIADRG
ncbi:MAG: DUF1887 family CARF protein [Firmicutes bacterium]|nr:DUF1887 family CARF protein [Bacillota bacterium]